MIKYQQFPTAIEAIFFKAVILIMVMVARVIQSAQKTVSRTKKSTGETNIWKL